jgi:hypothetical protein
MGRRHRAIAAPVRVRGIGLALYRTSLQRIDGHVHRQRGTDVRPECQRLLA